MIFGGNSTTFATGTRRRLAFCVIAAVTFFLLYILKVSHAENEVFYQGRPNTDQSDKVPAKDKSGEKFEMTEPHAKVEQPKRYAFATYLSANPNEDHYFIATRLLAYQLLHAPETRNRQPNIPFLVLVAPDVPADKQERLKKDGATVVQVDVLSAEWLVTDNKNWDGIFTKLRLFELTEFEKIAFLDGDTVLNQPMDGIFDDPATELQYTQNIEAEIHSDEGALPETYMFAGTPEMKHDHHYPPVSAEQGDYYNDNYFNGGFFIVRPSKDLFDYYMTVLNIPDRFESQLMEQSMLNYVHRREGNMPWKAVKSTWSIHYPKLEDVEQGAMSLHEKWWSPEDPNLAPYLLSWRWRMEGYYQGLDSASESKS